MENKKNVKILRIDEDTPEIAALKKVAQYCDNQVTREYANIDVLASPFISFPQIEVGKFFCSQLIAEAFLQQGIELLPDKEPAKIYPGDLAESLMLGDVTKQCIRVATDSDKLDFTGFIDGDELLTPKLEEVKLKQKIIKQINPLLNKYGIEAGTYDDLLGIIANELKSKSPNQWLTEVDHAFTNAIRDSGLFSLPDKYYPSNHDYFHLDIFLKELIQQYGLKTSEIVALEELSMLSG